MPFGPLWCDHDPDPARLAAPGIVVAKPIAWLALAMGDLHGAVDVRQVMKPGCQAGLARYNAQ